MDAESIAVGRSSGEDLTSSDSGATADALAHFLGAFQSLQALRPDSTMEDAFGGLRAALKTFVSARSVVTVPWNPEVGAFDFDDSEATGADGIPDQTEDDRDFFDWCVTNRSVSVLSIEKKDLQDRGLNTRVMVPLLSRSVPVGIAVCWCPLKEEEVTTLTLEGLRTIAHQFESILQGMTLYRHTGLVRNQFDSILESIPHAIFAIDLNDKITSVNSNCEFLFKIKRIDMLDERFQDVFSKDLANIFSTMVLDVLKTGAPADFQLDYQFEKNIQIFLGITASAMADVSREPHGIVFLCQDLSLSREIQKLRELDAMKSEFVHTVSHELKTPLAAIMGGAELLMLDEDLLSRDQLEIVQIIDNGSRRLKSLITDILSFSKMESGSAELLREEVNLFELIEETLSIIKPPENITVKLTQSNPLPNVVADRGRVRELIENLVTNAIKYSPEGGDVRIRVDGDETCVRVSVEDSGIGIPRDELASVFDKFHRTRLSTEMGIEGTGIGLAITKHIVEQHEGEIGVESEEGEGTTFWFSLPL